MNNVLLILIVIIGGFLLFKNGKKPDSVIAPEIERQEDIIQYSDIISYQIDPENREVRFFSVDEQGSSFANHGALKSWLASRDIELVFAINGRMYNSDLSPQGLYIEDNIEKVPIDTASAGYGNFYLQPNGIFWLSAEGKATVVSTDDYRDVGNIKYATQSGPMLIIDGEIHPAFNKDSENLHIRNGVGVLPNGNLLFAISKEKVTFYRLARYFQENKCNNALYLDGFVSRMYLPSKNWIQEEGNFGIIIAEVK